MTTEEMNDAADQYAKDVLGEDYETNQSYTDEVKLDFLNGLKAAQNILFNVSPRPPRPNAPPH